MALCVAVGGLQMSASRFWQVVTQRPVVVMAVEVAISQCICSHSSWLQVRELLSRWESLALSQR